MADCLGPIGVIGCAGQAVIGGAVDEAVDSGANNLGEAMMGGWDSLMKGFLTSWLDVGLLVSLEGDAVTWLTNQLQDLSVFFAIIGIMISAVWTMVHFRGDKAAGVGKSLLTVVLVTTLGTAVVQLALTIGDQFSDWVLESAGVTIDGFGTPAVAVSAIGPGLAIIAGIFGIIATAIQWIIMLIRATILPLLVAVWPVVAAASMIQGSEEAFSKLTKWMVAFILYKPVAAIIYAFAWRLKSGDDGIGGVLNGLLLLVLAVLALPALMRLITPGTSALGGAAGGSMALAAGAALGSAAVSAGAAVLTGGGSAAATSGTAGTAAKTASTTKASSTPSPTDGGPGTAATADGASGTPTTTSASGQTPSAPAGGAASDATGSTAEGSSSSSDSNGSTGSSVVGGASESAGQPGAAGTAAGTGQAPEGTPSEASGGSGAGNVASGAVPASEGSSGSSVPPSGGTSPGSTRGGAAARSAIESAGKSVADGAKDVNGEDVIGG